MSLLKYLFFNFFEMLIRMFPLPCRMGLVEIGHPGRNSPVFLTGNYHLTVQRVKRALRGWDAHLVVANSRGINVWCAAAGGHFSNHDVISALKTSGVEDVVGHRNVILPQLAASGVETKAISQRAGWKVIWGPVYAKDIPDFLKEDHRKNMRMREAQFPLIQRIEMAGAWAFPMSVMIALLFLLFWPDAVLESILFVWGLAVLIFAAFPLYHKKLRTGGRADSAVFDFGRGGLQLILWLGVLSGLFLYSTTVGDFSWRFLLFWGIFSLAVILVLSFDLGGSTPVLLSSFLEERRLQVALDTGKCRGAGFCEDICPRSCFIVDRIGRKASLSHKDRCIRCGACIVQCPFDALCFESGNGMKILPEHIRTHKLGLLGKRDVSL